MISHLILLTGFRESVFVLGIEFLIDLGISGYIQILIYSALSIFHIIGISNFYKKLIKDSPVLLILLLYVIPSFIAVAHLRYFLPLMPLSLLGVAMLLNRNNN